MTRKPKPIAYAEYVVVRLLTTAFLSAPLRASLAIARFIGSLLYHLDRRHRQVAVENLLKAFPGQLSEREAERIAKRVCQNMALVAAEMAWATRLLNPRTWQRYITVENWPLIEAMRTQGRGGIFLTAHVGNWEVVGIAAGLAGFPLHSVARPLDNELLDEHVTRFRRRNGQVLVPRKGALKKLLTVMKSNGYLAFLIDQNERSGGVFVDFFGRPASTVKSVAVMALKMQAPVLMAFAIREPGEFRFRVFIDGPVPVEHTGDKERDIERITADYTKRVERIVRQYPDQWLWLHRRWKTQPTP